MNEPEISPDNSGGLLLTPEGYKTLQQELEHIVRGSERIARSRSRRRMLLILHTRILAHPIGFSAKNNADVNLCSAIRNTREGSPAHVEMSCAR